MSGLMKLLSGDDGALARRTTEAILQTNELAHQYGLALTREQAVALQKAHAAALHDTMRVEIGASVVDKLILAFCDSPNLTMENYADTIGQLVELFYIVKSDILEMLSDDELIEQMKTFFDGSSGGSLELLAGRDLGTLSKNLRMYGRETPPNEQPAEQTLTDFDTQEDDRWRTLHF